MGRFVAELLQDSLHDPGETTKDTPQRHVWSTYNRMDLRSPVGYSHMSFLEDLLSPARFEKFGAGAEPRGS